ncbi:hypothetical protein THRCLA_10431, partial [Thraustotheca clavata]
MDLMCNPSHGDVPISRTTFEVVKDITGLCYIICSTLLGVYTLYQFLPYMNNDYFWPYFIEKNAASALTNIYNIQLPLMTNITSFDLTASSMIVSKQENVGINLAYPRMIIYYELANLASAVEGLRNLDVNQVVYMVSQYCWADLKRRWGMAHSSRRQERCQQRYIHNGAVYLETIFRNIDFYAWALSTQGLFNSHIEGAISSFDGGPDWLNYLNTHNTLSVVNEVAYLQSFNIYNFVLQYANEYQIGIKESLTIVNALGTNTSLHIKDTPWVNRGVLWTTNYLFAGFRSELNALSSNQSLIRNSSNFYGLQDESYLEYYNDGFPLRPIHQTIHNDIGQLSNIDLYWVQPPTDLINTIKNFRTLILTSISNNATFSNVFNNKSSGILQPIPRQWQTNHLLFYGGNPFCGFGAGLAIVQDSFGFDDACNVPRPLTLNWNAFNSLFAYLVMNKSISGVCDACINTALCLRLTSELVQSYSNLPSITPPELSHLKLSIVQFVSNSSNTTSTVWMENHEILSEDYAFFGWMSVYDWVMNEREVVSFEGDIRSYTLMSYATLPIATPQENIASAIAIYFWFSAAITSIGLCGIAALVILFWIVFRPWNCQWFIFYRLASSAWLNRALILMRGLVALLCLSTAPISPTIINHSTQFQTDPRSFLLTTLLAGEAIWITYVVHETLHPFSGEHTRIYAPWSSFLAWLLLVVVDMISPVEAEARIERSCYSMNMDYKVFCSSGVITIGSLQRTILNALITLVCVLVPLVLLPLVKRRSSDCPEVPSFLLSSAAVAFIRHRRQENVINDTFDEVTAVMVGIVRLPQCFFDTK